jgi:predicted DNA-binding protein
MVKNGWAIKGWGSYGETVAVRLPLEIKAQLAERAKERGLTLSDLIRLYIERGLDEEKRDRKFKTK